MSATAIRVGKILFALIFIVAAPRHFSSEGIQHASQLGTPFAHILVPISGVMALIGGLSVATGYKERWGAWILIAFLIPVTLFMHEFWKIQNPEESHVQLSMFAKNVSMIGAALVFTQLRMAPPKKQ
ncbi:MAG TPA: DoxX family membrane protein [Blastocatellia bacterium]